MKQPNDGQHQSGAGVTSNDQGELEMLRAECARLREQLKVLQKERDDLFKAVSAYVLADVTVEDIQKGIEPEEGGEPLSAFLPELEKMLAEHQS
jgi:hypothetical protein